MTTRPPLIVCVGGDASMLSALARCLRREALELRSTMSASEALGWIVADEVAVLLSDDEMPGMTGAQLAGYARQVRPETVRILLTGPRSLDGVNQGEIFRFIHKPFDHEQLRDEVNAAVVRHRELLVMSGDRERRERREALRIALEEEYPGISLVELRDDLWYQVTEDPWTEATELGLVGLTADLERGS